MEIIRSFEKSIACLKNNENLISKLLIYIILYASTNALTLISYDNHEKIGKVLTKTHEVTPDALMQALSLLGTDFLILLATVIITVILSGYLLRYMNNSKTEQGFLPEWEKPWELFKIGFKYNFATFLIIILLILSILTIVGPIIIGFMLPALMLLYVEEFRFKDALNLKRAWALMNKDYILTILFMGIIWILCYIPCSLTAIAFQQSPYIALVINTTIWSIYQITYSNMLMYLYRERKNNTPIEETCQS